MRFTRIFIDLIKWTGGLFLLFIIGINLSIIFYIEFAGNWLFTGNDKPRMIEEIKSAEALPALFYTVNEQYFPECHSQGFWICDLKYFFLNKPCFSESLQVSHNVFIHLNRQRISRLYQRFDSRAIARVIEKNIPLRQCYTYRMRFAEYGENTRNIDEAAETFFNKTIHELNEREVLSLHVIYTAPTRFSLRRNPQKLNDKVESLMKMYKK